VLLLFVNLASTSIGFNLNNFALRSSEPPP